MKRLENELLFDTSDELLCLHIILFAIMQTIFRIKSMNGRFKLKQNQCKLTFEPNSFTIT